MRQVGYLPELCYLVSSYGGIYTEVHVKIFSSTFAELSARLHIVTGKLNRSCLTLRRLMSYIYIYIYIWSTHS